MDEDKKVDKVIPVIFDQIEEIDNRFTRVKIWLMHLGENLNGSVFTKEIVDAALTTLANIPILGYIENNSQNDEDFSDHRTVLAKKNGEWGWIYKGSAYGVIPESNNAQYEMRMCDDGIEREFLTVEGLMWNKWDSPIDIMNRDTSKSQSMELHDDYEGYFDKNGKFHFTKFSFFGACILGRDTKPAMVNSTVELFSAKDITSQIQFHLVEFEKAMVKHKKNTSSEGGSEVDEKLKLLAKYNVTAEQLGINIDETDLAALEVSAKNFVASLQNNTEDSSGKTDVTSVTTATTTSNTKEEVVPTSDNIETPSNFSLSAGQMREALRIRLKEEGGTSVDADWGYTISNYYYVDHTESEVIAESRIDNWQLVGLSFVMNGDVPNIDLESKRRMKIVYAPLEGSVEDLAFSVVSDERKAYESKVVESKFNKEMDVLKGQLVSVQGEVEALKEFKATKTTEERKTSVDNLFIDKRFSQLTEEDVAAFKVDCYISDKSIETIEETLFSMLGKKFAAKFAVSSTPAKTTGVKVEVQPTSTSGGKVYDGLIAKYKNNK